MSNQKDTINKVRSIIQRSSNIVFFGGAGVSTESNIPDFRSSEGLFKQERSAEEILSASFFKKHPKEFYAFYKNQMIHAHARPNPAHHTLARLEQQGKLRAVITQNIDGLHQLAGSNIVLELHGSVHRNFCTECETFYSIDQILNSTEPVPRCVQCNGIIKPDVVLYEENLDEDIIDSALDFIAKAEVLIVGGTSLRVFPAAGLLNYYGGEHFVLINQAPTSYDFRADYVIYDQIGKVMSQFI
ncbi:NAD-dependent protein deacylase [Chengkuizengella axinellae]|uniref:NAD-dependent protein deacetylase n=1 Tax=Chengkuizengella axinellae TaxID=3064388 RepID=A0ABT9IV74_9BACL|nr:NAD-dependent protein deacylase [Chengkuizengella sp. 2205SS18-9]MDP5273266.1 NAD-dependent protein deacylase [Chengkuizengella sp. 2205SS18-9]